MRPCMLLRPLAVNRLPAILRESILVVTVGGKPASACRALHSLSAAPLDWTILRFYIAKGLARDCLPQQPL